MRTLLRSWHWLCLVPLLVGCGSQTATVSGKVTYEGEPVKKGYISFLPEGPGPTAGAPIESGTYSLSGLQPGKKRVVVAAVKEQKAVTSSGDAPTGKTAKPGDSADLIAPTAEGNNQVVEVKLGSQTLDFQLRAAGKK